MIKKLVPIAAVFAFSLSLTAPAQATVLLPNTTLQPTAPFPAGTEGTVLASQSFTGQAFTFGATFNQAVYRNANGTLDFYYQVIRTGAGTAGNSEIRSFTVANFDGFFVDAFVNGADTDGAGPFVPVNNPALANGTASGSTTTFGRSPDGNVITTEFGANGLTGTENSTTYIFRTNATTFNNLGFFGIIDGSTLSGRTFAPTAAVPEPGTWGMMLIGFGALGVSMRRRRRSNALVAKVA
jgi:hypothetical protein